MYYDFNAGSKEYKLRLNTRNVVELEKKLGCNPIMVFGMEGDKIPTVSTMVVILHASLQTYNHGVSMNDAYDIFDAYIEDGHTSVDFIKVIMEIYKASGIVPNEVEGEGEKN
jgi:hypothetical protein